MNSIIDINLDYRIKWYVHGSIPYPKEVKVNMLSLCFNWAPRHEGVLREWKYGATYSWWRWVVSFTLRPLYPQGKSPWYPLDAFNISTFLELFTYLIHQVTIERLRHSGSAAALSDEGVDIYQLTDTDAAVTQSALWNYRNKAPLVSESTT